MISKDAGLVLKHVYDRPKGSSSQIETISDWDRARVNAAIKYLIEEGTIASEYKTGDGVYHKLECSNTGINRIEKPEEFGSIYGFALNINVTADALFKADVRLF